MTTDPDRPDPCDHPDFLAEVDVHRLTDDEDGPVTGHTADVRVMCAACGTPFRWLGIPAGVSWRRPMCSADRTELRAPLQPATRPRSTTTTQETTP